MPGLFEQFPHTNFHELNLDWMIDLLNTFKDELENRVVLSVNGMTGEVTLYESENVVLPPLTNASSWRLVRMMDGQYVGVLFQDGHVWLQQGNSTLKLLTTEDIPTSAGVVSINGMGGVVRITGRDIPISDDPDADSIRLALETEHTERVNADNALQNAINTLNNKFTSNVLTTSHTVENSVCSRTGSQVLINASVKLTSDVSPWSTFATIPASLHPYAPTRGFAEVDGAIVPIYIGSAGNLQFTQAAVTSGTIVVLVLSYSL